MKAKVSIRSLGTKGRDEFQPLGIIFLVLALVLAGVIVYMLAHRVVDERTLFDTDEASHATPALDLYVAVQRGRTADFGRAIFQQSFYPPVHSLTVLPSYVLAGPTLASTRLPTVVMFALLLIAAALLTHRVTSQIQGVGSGIACVATAATVYFLATSPILIQNAVISMLELLGCLWVILLLWVCWRIDNDLGGRWTPVLFLALMLFVITLTKYSFGVTAIPAAVAAILIGTKSGNAKRSQLIEAGLVLVVLAASLGLWFMAAGLRGALRFAFDQPRYAPLLSAENLFYYPRAWLKDFHLHPVFGLATVLLAIWGAIKGWNRLTVRAASWVACFSLLILTVSLNNQPRHFVFASPGLWFLAALGLAHLLVKLVKAVRSRSLQSVSLIIMFAFLGMSAFQRAKALEPELTYAFEGQYGDRNQAMQSYIIDNVDLEDRVLILGLFDQLNATAIRWQMAIETGRAPSEIRVETEPQVDLGRIRLPSDAADGDDYEALVLRAAAMEAYYSQIVVLRSRNSTDPYVVAAPSVLRDFKSMSRRFDDYEIEIFDLSDRR